MPTILLGSWPQLSMVLLQLHFSKHMKQNGSRYFHFCFGLLLYLITSYIPSSPHFCTSSPCFLIPRLRFAIRHLVFRTSEQLWKSPLPLGLTQMLRIQVLKELHSLEISNNHNFSNGHFACIDRSNYDFLFTPFLLAVHRVINDGLGSILSSRVQRVILDGLFSIGRAQLSEAILNEKNPVGLSRLARLKRIFEEGKSLQLQFPAEDLGYR